MDDLKVVCHKCKCELAHVCNKDVKQAAARLFSACADDDREHRVLFSEDYLYDKLGKEDARTVLALVKNLLTACGLDPYQDFAKKDE